MDGGAFEGRGIIDREMLMPRCCGSGSKPRLLLLLVVVVLVVVSVAESNKGGEWTWGLILLKFRLSISSALLKSVPNSRLLVWVVLSCISGQHCHSLIRSFQIFFSKDSEKKLRFIYLF